MIIVVNINTSTTCNSVSTARGFLIKFYNILFYSITFIYILTIFDISKPLLWAYAREGFYRGGVI